FQGVGRGAGEGAAVEVQGQRQLQVGNADLVRLRVGAFVVAALAGGRLGRTVGGGCRIGGAGLFAGATAGGGSHGKGKQQGWKTHGEARSGKAPSVTRGPRQPPFRATSAAPGTARRKSGAHTGVEGGAATQAPAPRRLTRGSRCAPRRCRR